MPGPETPAKRVALITGASSGIGRELARLHAATGGDLVILARREAELQTLAKELEAEHGVRVHCLAADLADPATPQRVFDEVTAAGIEVEYLINNAGFGGHGRFHERDWVKDHAMIQVNVTALAKLTRLFLPGMIERQRGRVLNNASIAAFAPGPLQAIYHATKAFVASFSQAIDEELRSAGANVTVTALCPGPVETEFAAVGNLEGVDALKNAKSAESVAKIGYDAMMQGKLIAINELKFRLLMGWIVPFLPRRSVLKITRGMLDKPDGK